MNDKTNKIKELFTRVLPFSGLIISTFATVYFQAIARYNINTVFNVEKRGYFGFLFTKKTFAKKGWVFKFSAFLLVSYLLSKLFSGLIILTKNLSKQKLTKLLAKNSTLDNYEEVVFLSEGVVDKFALFFLLLCELLIELWSAISINLTRRIGATWKPAFVCVLWIFWVIDIATNFIGKNSGNKSRKSNPYYLSNWLIPALKETRFSALNILFTACYFLFFSLDDKTNQKELINVVLLGIAFSTVASKVRNFFNAIPEVVSTYKLFREYNKTESSLVSPKILLEI